MTRKSSDQTSSHKVKQAVTLVIADGHTNLFEGFVSVSMGKHIYHNLTYFITLKVPTDISGKTLIKSMK